VAISAALPLEVARSPVEFFALITNLKNFRKIGKYAAGLLQRPFLAGCAPFNIL